MCGISPAPWRRFRQATLGYPGGVASIVAQTHTRAVIRWRQLLSFLLCLSLLSGSVSGAHLHLCGHDGDHAASLQVHSPQHLELHLGDKPGAADLDVELLAGMLKKLEHLEPGAVAPPLALLLVINPVTGSQPPAYRDVPAPAGRPQLLPPLRAPPLILPA